jgi:hypothetical protein
MESAYDKPNRLKKNNLIGKKKSRINSNRQSKKQFKKNRKISNNRNLQNYDPNLPWWLQWLPISSSNSRSSWGNNSDGWTWGNNSNRGWGNDYDRNWRNDSRYDSRYDSSYDRSYRRNNYGNNYSNQDALFNITFDSDD